MKRQIAALVVATALLTACGDPLAQDSNGGEAIVIGSQDYYSNEIVAEIYSQALEDEGFVVDRQYRIGQREAYLPEVESGAIDVIPEYTGNLLQYYEPDTPARESEDVYEALSAAVPSGTRILHQADATDQDSYTVTRGFASRWGLEVMSDLADVEDPMVLGANSEAQERPYGPAGLATAIGVEIGFSPIEDSGGPLTVKALVEGDVQLANIYTSDPAIKKNNLVSLRDDIGLFLASHVVPLVGDGLDDRAAQRINEVNEHLSADALISLNLRSVDEQLPSETIAREWLAKEGLVS